ncbi:MAG: hypothetical protein KBB11_02915 [Bacteroidales bacterium]|nr:hypothetical protein [Bacteroidales bacterium]HOY37812.1 hypothetical protein [Bacteroidales bacterium]HQP04192.1 hypothetical protein [Bacteroidales bacterium]
MKEFHVESKVVKVPQHDEKIFNFLSDFRNFNSFIPPDLEEWTSDAESCSFKAKGQRISLIFAAKEPFKTIKITSKAENPFEFFFWIQLKAVDSSSTAIKLTIEAELNVIMRNMLEKPAKQMLDKLADALCNLSYQTT